MRPQHVYRFFFDPRVPLINMDSLSLATASRVAWLAWLSRVAVYVSPADRYAFPRFASLGPKDRTQTGLGAQHAHEGQAARWKVVCAFAAFYLKGRLQDQCIRAFRSSIEYDRFPKINTIQQPYPYPNLSQCQ